MRGCVDCHQADESHAFLPYQRLHFKALACQTCHIPKVHFWAYRSDEWGFLTDTGTSRITFRGIDGDIVNPEARVTGFKPAFITMPAADGRLQIRPTNLITGVSWFDKVKGRPVFNWQVREALFSGFEPDNGWVYRPEILKAFADQDGFVDPEKATYDSPERIALVRGLLQKHARIADPELRIEVVPWAMSHSIVGKDQAIRECTACHARRSVLRRAMDLDSFLPGMDDFTAGAFRQAHHYLIGIFRGEPHPFEIDPFHKLNPLQKITYLALLNVLLPFEIFLGVMMWGASRWPATFDAVGGLKVLGPARTLGAYLFLAFLISHLSSRRPVTPR